MKEKIKLNTTYSLDMGSLAPIAVRTEEFVESGVKCTYLSSWSGRVEIVGYDIFEMNGYEKKKV